MRKVLRQLNFERNMLKKTTRTAKEAVAVLNERYSHAAPDFEQQNVLNPQHDLMIVIPVYNVEAFLAECLDSVLSQKTQYSFCVVAIDDGSTDNSATLLKAYESDKRVKVIYQQNKGVAHARNIALEHIMGRYVLFVDSDDRLPDGTIEALMTAAYEHDADIVQGAYIKFNDNGVIGVFDKVESVREIALAAVTGYAGMKPIKAEVLENFCFPEGYLYEDTVLGKLLYPLCKKAVAIPQTVYEYRIHSVTISGAKQTAKNLDTYWITQYCLEEAARRGYTLDSKVYEQYLRQCWINFLRTQYMDVEIQESLFVATAELYSRYFGDVKLKTNDKKLKLLHRALCKRSYAAYVFLMKRWEIM